MSTRDVNVEALKAPNGVGVWGRVSPPQKTRGSGGALSAFSVGSWAKPQPQTHFLHTLGYRMLLAGRKNSFSVKFSSTNY